jgi:hypothetical protein
MSIVSGFIDILAGRVYLIDVLHQYVDIPRQYRHIRSICRFHRQVRDLCRKNGDFRHMVGKWRHRDSRMQEA